MLTREEKRGEMERRRKKKFRHLKNMGLLSEFYKQKRESKLNQVIMAQVEPLEIKEEKAEIEIKKQTNMDFSFLKANRFWVLVAGCLTIIIEGNFTFDSIMKAISAFAIGFITVRTIDRATENIAKG